MNYIKIFEEYDPNYNPYPYKVLNPGQIQHYRQVFRLRQAKDVDYAWKILDTVEKNEGKISLKQWNVIQKTYHGGNYPVNY